MKTLYTIIFLFVALDSFSQNDVIYKKNGDTLICDVIDVNKDNIRYSITTGSEPIYFSSKRNGIRYLVMDGQRLNISSFQKNQKQNKSWLLKFDPAGLYFGGLTIAYEKHIRQNVSFETNLAYVHPAALQFYGFLGTIGVRLYHEKSYLTDNAQRFTGLYVKPELMYSGLVYRGSFGDGENETPSYLLFSRSFGGSVNIGYQHLFGNTLTLDYYFGLGAGFRKNQFEDYEHLKENFRFNWLQGGRENPYIVNYGVRLGFIF